MRRREFITLLGGVAGGGLAACVVALFGGAPSATFGGAGQELFNAAILGIAVIMGGAPSRFRSVDRSEQRPQGVIGARE
jgi:hypothetical protein